MPTRLVINFVQNPQTNEFHNILKKIDKITDPQHIQENTNDATRTAKSDVTRAIRMKSSPNEEKKEEPAVQPVAFPQEALAPPPEPSKELEQRPAEAPPAPVSEENKSAEAPKVDSREKEPPVKEELKQESEMPKGLISPNIITDQVNMDSWEILATRRKLRRCIGSSRKRQESAFQLKKSMKISFKIDFQPYFLAEQDGD